MKQLLKSKQGQATQAIVATVSVIGVIALSFGIAIIVSSLTTDITDDIQDGMETATCIKADGNANCSLAFNSTQSGLEGLEDFQDNYTTIGTVLGATILILVVIAGLGFFIGRRFMG